MLDVTTLLEELKASPYEETPIYAQHTGVVTFENLNPGDKLLGPHGTWKEKRGTRLATLTRERNVKPIEAHQKGEVCRLNRELEGHFVEAGTELGLVRHYLSRDEVQNIILREALDLFLAPERAKYYFSPQLDMKVKASGCQSVSVHEGMELFIMSRMKREMPLYYTGAEGLIYAVYFQHNENVDAGAPLIGVCPPDQLKDIEEVILRIQTEWQEKD